MEKFCTPIAREYSWSLTMCVTYKGALSQKWMILCYLLEFHCFKAKNAIRWHPYCMSIVNRLPLQGVSTLNVIAISKNNPINSFNHRYTILAACQWLLRLILRCTYVNIYLVIVQLLSNSSVRSCNVSPHHFKVVLFLVRCGKLLNINSAQKAKLSCSSGDWPCHIEVAMDISMSSGIGYLTSGYQPCVVVLGRDNTFW